ncbi:ABC transporter permease, partial [Candidatus Bipolaricaulota bacterium]|nr:ABC transporter permease [Candidatus Bipolaricaulota bacterium]
TEHVEVTVQKVGGEARTVKYAEFLLPGVLLMTLFVTAIFSIPTIVLYAKETGILRRYLATPLSGGQYFLGSALGMAFLNGAQIVSLWALGWLALGVRLPLLRPESLAFLFLSFATFMALGFLISALSRTHQGAMALANLLNLPLQFLGGLYFPITSFPKALRIIMAVNPLTHLAEGWRAALGLSSSSFPLWANFLVPFLWLLGSAALAVKRMRFGEEG